MILQYRPLNDVFAAKVETVDHVSLQQWIVYFQSSYVWWLSPFIDARSKHFVSINGRFAKAILIFAFVKHCRLCWLHAIVIIIRFFEIIAD